MDPVTAAVLIGVIRATASTMQDWLHWQARRCVGPHRAADTAGRLYPVGELRSGLAYQIPPGGRVRELDGAWLVIEAVDRGGRADGLR